jgi:hypothetical protein
MTCRHSPFDPNCGSYDSNIRQLKANYEKQIVGAITPDKMNFEIEEIEEVGAFLVMQVKYPNCVKCSYEGSKILVFENVTMKDVLKWREIDPHFRDPSEAREPKRAPSPIARFPANARGWEMAIQFCKDSEER